LDTNAVDWMSRIAQSLVSNILYAEKMVLPLHLNPLDWRYHGYDFSQAIVWKALGINLGIILFFALLARRHPSGLIAWISYLVIIAPFLGLAQSGLQLTADRYTYLSMVPLCIWVGGVFQSLWEGALTPSFARWLSARRSLLILAVGMLLGGSGWGTYQQVKVWKDSETFWIYCLSLDPNNPLALNNLGAVYSQKKEYAKAIANYQRALRIYPDYGDAWHNLGNACQRMGRYQEAVVACQKLLVLEPSHVEACMILGESYIKLKNVPMALRYYKKAMKFEPSARGFCAIGLCYELMEDDPPALYFYEQSARLGDPDAWVKWSNLVRKRGDAPRALEILTRAMSQISDPRVRVAYAETVLGMKDPGSHEIEMAGKFLIEVDRRLNGASERVRHLLAIYRAKRVKDSSRK